ncbi:nucleotidyltransferase domain-containing protein [Galbitalea soli]|uniref:Helix-turn-helix domain-containing protein n=1 Tax=Galbitalea soli TaxID=1268042 RepID=A0A7C9TPV8_9MICO|nr:nucleotidyltransferase domain-containing protein [Galbitalea soli]NEM90795.1 helix-turn-helix domain-containing protein [Galbitalea soli]NYJ31513.1 hypothetical protein [Galbitalea soli]
MTSTAAAAIREARAHAQLTQTGLAQRAGLTQSVVSAYETAHREPSVDTLRRILRAAGFDLELSLRTAAPRSDRRESVDRHRTALRRALRQLGARDVWLFGSVARGDDGPESDIDLLVEVGPSVGLFDLGRMRTEAERILNAPVDIVPTNSLKADVVARAMSESIRL